ncbi:glycerophosphodiester phosphodiesterase [Salinimonas chungwhensis]|uniref:glycerophosphodiester phosphodiesterase n=1 Tax=Salinimonas chungwhensis TaxID=265425 RepID=UPI0003777B5F|nr:glycerophosphodiester phosphodiesterase [Salinimonas chungwhensis]
MLFRALVIVFSLYPACSVWATDIIAHRGASGYLPEHTLEAATLAFAQFPDYIEQDVVLAADDTPIVLHDIHLETVTNVEQVFPNRARADGRFYVRDFTLAELRKLQVHERQTKEHADVFAHRYSGSTAHFTIATLAEHIELIRELNAAYNRKTGMYIEIKSPRWHNKEGADISNIVLQTINQEGLTAPDSRLVLQCFDFAEIKRIRQQLNYKGTLIQLVGLNSWQESQTDYDWLLSEPGLDALATVADGIGPWIPQMFDKPEAAKGLGEVREWVRQAQTRKLLLHPYTFRTDALPNGISSQQLLQRLFNDANVDGIFTDQVPPVKAYLEHNR